jgi:hypothetical protein
VEKLSEQEPTSDRFGDERLKVVRSRGNFRQVWCRKRKNCLKEGQLRTGSSGKEKKLSEHEQPFIKNTDKLINSLS